MSWEPFDVDAALAQLRQERSLPASTGSGERPDLSKISGVSDLSRGLCRSRETQTSEPAANEAEESLSHGIASPRPTHKPDRQETASPPAKAAKAAKSANTPSIIRDRRENDRSPTNRGKSPTHYFSESVGRAWCPPGDFERRLRRTVPGRPLVALPAKLGLVLRCVEAGILTHREARALAVKLTEEQKENAA